MTNRLGLIPYADMNEEQKGLHDSLVDFIKGRYDDPETSPQLFTDNGSLIGPYGIVLHHPAAGRGFFSLARAVLGIPGLSLYDREVVIAVAGSRSHAAYEQYAHHIIATKRAGITKEELREIEAGICPKTLTNEGKAAFELATALGNPGALDQAAYDRAVKVLGKDGTAAVIHITGFYSYVGTILNGFDAQVP